MSPPAIQLRVAPKGGEAFVHRFEQGEVVIGRSSVCDLTLDDRFLSRRHTRLHCRGDALVVEDLDSRNGSLLNGRPIHQPTVLEPGDVLELSKWTLTLLPSDDQTDDGESDIADLGGHTILRSANHLLNRDERTRDGLDEEALRRYAERLELLNDVHRALGQFLELDELLELILDRVFDHLQPEQGAIFLDRGEGQLERAATRSRDPGEGEIVFSRSLMREVTKKRMAALVLDVEDDERFRSAHSLLATGIRSLVAAPLLDRQGCLGMIALSSKISTRRFDEGDMELLVSLASVAALSLRNVALAEGAAEQRRLEKELALGREIQKALLPDRLPAVEGYDLYAVNRPSRGVSGDYYQVLERAGGEVVAMIADVSGKGISASLLTASLEALAIGPIEDGQSPEEIFDRLSRRLHHRTPAERYATAFVAVLEPACGRLRYANAGHNPGLLLRSDGDVEELASTGPPLGLLRSTQYRLAETILGPGDLMVLYTDGITEAMDPDGREFGEERLLDACRGHRDDPLPELVDHLKSELETFVRGVPFDDDRTLVLVRRRD